MYENSLCSEYIYIYNIYYIYIYIYIYLLRINIFSISAKYYPVLTFINIRQYLHTSVKLQIYMILLFMSDYFCLFIKYDVFSIGSIQSSSHGYLLLIILDSYLLNEFSISVDEVYFLIELLYIYEYVYI